MAPARRFPLGYRQATTGVPPRVRLPHPPPTFPVAFSTAFPVAASLAIIHRPLLAWRGITLAPDLRSNGSYDASRSIGVLLTLLRS